MFPNILIALIKFFVPKGDYLTRYYLNQTPLEE